MALVATPTIVDRSSPVRKGTQRKEVSASYTCTGSDTYVTGGVTPAAAGLGLTVVKRLKGAWTVGKYHAQVSADFDEILQRIMRPRSDGHAQAALA